MPQRHDRRIARPTRVKARRRAVVMAVLSGMLGVGFDVQTLPAQDSRPYESTTESPRLYNPDAAAMVRGTILNLETVKPAEDSAAFLQLVLRTGKEEIRVHLAPQWYMKEQGHRLALAKGAEVEITGSRTVVNGEDVLIAAEIKAVRTEDRLRLRHKDGTPVWSGSERAS